MASTNAKGECVIPESNRDTSPVLKKSGRVLVRMDIPRPIRRVLVRARKKWQDLTD